MVWRIPPEVLVRGQLPQVRTLRVARRVRLQQIVAAPGGRQSVPMGGVDETARVDRSAAVDQAASYGVRLQCA